MSQGEGERWQRWNPYRLRYHPGSIRATTGEVFYWRLTRETVAFHQEQREAFCIHLEKQTGQPLSRYFLEIHPQPGENLLVARSQAPRYVKHFAKQRGVTSYIRVRIAYIETLPACTGEGLGTLISRLGDTLIQQWSDQLQIPIISYTNDSSHGRWTSRTHTQLLGYEVLGHFLPLPLLHLLNRGQEFVEVRTRIALRPRLGPRLVKLFESSSPGYEVGAAEDQLIISLNVGPFCPQGVRRLQRVKHILGSLDY